MKNYWTPPTIIGVIAIILIAIGLAILKEQAALLFSVTGLGLLVLIFAKYMATKIDKDNYG